MDFLLSQDQQAVSELVSSFLKGEIAPEKVRKAVEQSESVGRLPELDIELWKRFCELGVLGGLLPESLGGLGLGLLSASAVLEASSSPIQQLPIYQTISAALLPLRLLQPTSTILEKKAADVAERIVSGQALASGVLLSEGEGLELIRDKDGIILSGEFFPVLGSPGLELFFVTLESEDGTNVYLFEKELQNEGAWHFEEESTIDLLRSYGTLSFLEAKGLHLGTLPKSDTALTMLELAECVLCAAELCGLGQVVVALSLEYVKTREQFNRPVGTFQAIQHKLADMHLAVEQGLALTRFAARCFDENDPQFGSAAMAAKLFAAENIPKVIEDAIQAHGGIGFTFEHDLHLYLRRAKAQAQVGNDTKELAQLLSAHYGSD